MQADPSYAAYVRYCGSVGSPILDYEAWARLRHKLDRGEPAATKLREDWLTSERDSVQHRRGSGSKVGSSRPQGGAASANLPSSPAPFKPVLAATLENPGVPSFIDPNRRGRRPVTPMTALDKFEPVGEQIHPFDLFRLLTDWPSIQDVFNLQDAPAAIDEDDYLRNIHKIGQNIRVGHKPYFVTTGKMPSAQELA